MDYTELKAALADPHYITEAPFAILRDIARHVNDRATHNQGRDLIIRALAVIDSFGKDEQEILFSLVRSVGLFPYMKDNLASADFSDYLAYELHRVDTLDGDIVFHGLQARIYNQLISGANVVLSASTSVGKSLIIDALVASGKYKTIVVVVPTIALIDETRRRLNFRFGEKCAIITHPSQKAKSNSINVYVLTQERVLHREDLEKVDIFIIDEFYKLDFMGDKDTARTIDLNLAFHKLARTGAQFYLLGPNVQAVSGLDAYEYHFIPSEYSTVAVDVVCFDLPMRGEGRNEKLLELCQTLDGPTIVYCQSPRSATEVATFLARQAGLERTNETLPAVEWIAENYHPEWAICEALRYGIGVHHGGVPRALQQYFIRLFNSRQIRFLVCTSTIIEGVNTVAKNVIIYDRRKNTNLLEYFTYKNIAGRAGRMQEYYIGRVYVLETPPQNKNYAVEVPVGQQGTETPIGLLLPMNETDLTASSRERLEEHFRKSSLSPETLRLNRYAALDVQEGIAAMIRENLDYYHKLLSWKGVPDGPELEAVCRLIYENTDSSIFRDYGIHSGDSLAWHINNLRMSEDKNLTSYLQARIEDRPDDQTISQSVENALKFIRNILCQRFPRDLMVVEAIQREVFSRSGLTYGEYGVFAEQAENLFLPALLYALDEYGIPIQTAQKLASILLPAESLDVVLSRLKHLRLVNLELSSFESEIVEDVRRSIFLGPMDE